MHKLDGQGRKEHQKSEHNELEGEGGWGLIYNLKYEEGERSLKNEHSC